MKKKYKNTFWFSVAHAMKKNFILPLLTFAVSMFFYLSNFCWDVLREAKNKAAITGQDVMKLMREAYEVFIFDSERAAYEPLISFYPALLVVISLLVGVLLFRFVTNKKTVNVYYSLGIKRADLYTARLLAGVFMMLAAVLVPLAVSLGLNLHYFGSSVMLWRALLFYAVHMTVTALAGFTVAAAVSVCVGTAGESVLFSLAFIAFPSAAVYFLNNAVPHLLFGAPHNSNYALYPSASHNQDISMALSPFGRVLSYLNLPMLNNDAFIRSGTFVSNGFSAMSADELKSWSAPSLEPYILWAILTALLFVFGLLMLKRRKVEICGFSGRSKALNFLLTAMLCFRRLDYRRR